MKNLILLLILSSLLIAQKRILIDENFSDWNDISTYTVDPLGDNTGSNFDFDTLFVANNDDYLYMRVETTEKFNLVDHNFMTLYIDTDNNTSTGKSVHGIGAELEYTFGSRKGKAYLTGEQTVYHDNIGFFGAPTFSANDFEFVIDRHTEISGTALFPNNTIKVVMIDYSSSDLSDSYDQVPNSGGFEYSFQSAASDPTPKYSINKTNIGYLRLMAYNTAYDYGDVQKEKILQAQNSDRFNRIFNVIQPDIIGLCEIYDASSQQIADKMEEFLPSASGENWYNKKEVSDIVLLSRFQIKESFKIDSDVGHDASGAFLLDLRPKYDSDMLVIEAHPKCCTSVGNEDEKRQNQFDAIIAFIRDAVNDGGDLTIAPNIPIVIMGDMNLVGSVRQYVTLTTGNIYYEGTYGEDFAPDWDGGSLDDSKPYVTNTGMTYTTNEGSYPPGRLDYIVFSGSVMKAVNKYVLNSQKLTESQLSESGLTKNDNQVSDHLPVVVDFDLSPITDVKKKDETPKKFGLMQNYPNPFNPSTTIKFDIPNVGTSRDLSPTVKLIVYDMLGREVKTLLNKSLQPGNYEVEFNGNELPNGIYFYKLTTDGFSQTRKMLLLK